ncbi:hypothetical protein PMAYCL1PPCAC_28247, partial [Pristionchus mayeri]
KGAHFRREKGGNGEVNRSRKDGGISRMKWVKRMQEIEFNSECSEQLMIVVIRTIGTSNGTANNNQQLPGALTGILTNGDCERKTRSVRFFVCSIKDLATYLRP